MSEAVVADTDVLSFMFKKDSRAGGYRTHLEGRSVILSFQTVAEFWRWSYQRNWGSRRQERMEGFLSQFAVCHSNHELNVRWAELMVESRRAGRPLLAQDAWVAATAMELGIPLVSHNRRDFESLAGLHLISESP